MAQALPSAGEELPGFTAKDLHGRQRSSAELAGRPALVVATRDRDGAPEVRDWFLAAQSQVPPEARADRVAVISLELPFFIPSGMVRSRARSKVPERHWDDVLLDRNGAMAEALGLPEGEEPVAMAVSPDGQVLAVARGGPQGPEAARVWQALSR